MYFFPYINVFFVIYLIGYSSFLFLAVVVGSSELYKKRHQEKLKNTLLQNYYVPISIIVPAYNEEVTVVETVKSLLALEYKLYEIVVVDDGSKDNTSQKLIEAFDMKPIRRPIHRKIPRNCHNPIQNTSRGYIHLLHHWSRNNYCLVLRQ